MTRSTRQTLWLALGVVVLVVLTAWQMQNDSTNAPGTLLALEPSAVTRIEIATQGQPLQHYVKRDGHWWQLTPTPVRSDDGRLEDIADIAAAPVLQWRRASELDANKIGLVEPALVLTLNDQRIAYGAIGTFGPQRYVQVGQRIALIGAQYAPRAVQPVKTMR